MHRRTKRLGAATVATAAAVALAAGLTSPASAEPGQRGQPVPGAAKATSHQHITLITGDRVTVNAQGKVVGLQRGEGRSHIPVQIRKARGHTLVVPADAIRMVADGKVDQRLFDITELSTTAARTSQKNGLKVIVGYRGAAAAAKADVRDAGTLHRSLKTLNADAVQTPLEDAGKLWRTVTRGDRTAAGIANVWLDGVRKVALDTSVPQIGAPKAWGAGYDGRGVKIAVLDTGVDAGHPDLKSRVKASKNFSTARDAIDRHGHGTHVASIVAGTGARSGGKLKGVAPGAEILNGKVLDDAGSGSDAGVLAGIEWAAAQGVDIVNMSLGGADTPGVDPLEAAVNRLSAEKGILFAVAAGNEGPQSVGSPGSADAALTVGAVNGKDELAEFSSTGPRVGDGAVKPDLTAPGVDITAASVKGGVIEREVGEKPAGYLTISGTSMATPHVAGAAALLKQQHPDWTYTELKGALTGSAKAGPYTPFEQGSGRVQVDKAIRQTALADPVSVGFPVQQWPHSDDTPVTKKLTYRNIGTKDVHLSLGVKGFRPDGTAAPGGFFKLGATKVTVPAGGSASVGLTADTRLGGTVDGAYSATVTATGGGQTVRVSAAVQREAESYDVTIRHIGRGGRPTDDYSTTLEGYSGPGDDLTVSAPPAESGTTTVRVPKGTYLLDSFITEDSPTPLGAADWLIQPKLTVDKATTVTLDARRTKAANITVPDTGAKRLSATISVADPAEGMDVGVSVDAFSRLRVAHVGPAASRNLSQSWSGQWTKGASAEYHVATSARVKKIQNDKVRHFKKGELATVVNSLSASVPGKKGGLMAWGMLADHVAFGVPVQQKLPSRRTLFVSTGEKIEWTLDFEQYGGAGADGWPIVDVHQGTITPRTYRAGRTYTHAFNKAVLGPHLDVEHGLHREGNDISGYLPLLSDSSGHFGVSTLTAVNTTLYRNGTKVGSHRDPFLGDAHFTVPSGDAQYKLTASIKRSATVAATSTRVDASWTFRSKKSAADKVTLPASTVRFKANTSLDGRVPAGRTAAVPVTVEGAAAGRNLKALTVHASYDAGRTWKKLTVAKGKVTVKNPAKGKAISYRATVTDKKGNKSTVTIHNAYLGQ